LVTFLVSFLLFFTKIFVIRGKKMILRLSPSEFDSMLKVVNDAAQAYRGEIPEDRWKEPYMSAEELRKEIGNGVEFYGWVENSVLVAVMGIQLVGDVTLIRHSYVLTSYQRRGIGEYLLKHLVGLARTSEVLVGTWEAAYWAVRFYEKHEFRLVSKEEKERLLREYWNIPERQIETSVVLRLKKKTGSSSSAYSLH
jgi:GNAT superfamily N-acetyltransferase